MTITLLCPNCGFETFTDVDPFEDEVMFPIVCDDCGKKIVVEVKVYLKGGDGE